MNQPGRLIAAIALIIVGVAGAGGGAYLVHGQLRPHPTKAQITAAVRKEVASRWRRLTAGQIFPAVIRYTDSESLATTATRVGIAPPSTCQTALDPSAEKVVGPLGCAVVLRATYADASGTLVATIGVAVLKSASAAKSADGSLTANGGQAGGVLAVPFTRTIASGFHDRQRTTFGAVSAGPYLFLFAGGYADGRIATSQEASEDILTLGDAAASQVESALTGYSNPCNLKDISC